MWQHLRLLPWSLVVLAVLSCPAEASSTECKGTESCDEEEETTLMHLSAAVTQRVLKSKGAEEGTPNQATLSAHPGAVEASPLPFSNIFGISVADESNTLLQAKATSLLQTKATEHERPAHTEHTEHDHADKRLPFPVFGAALLQLKASSLAHEHKQEEQASGRAPVISLGQATTSFTSASESHMLAYVVLFGIVMVLMGLGLLVVMGMKKEDEYYDASPNNFDIHGQTIDKGPQTPQQAYQYGRPPTDTAPMSAPLMSQQQMPAYPSQAATPGWGQGLSPAAAPVLPGPGSPLAGQQMNQMQQMQQQQQMQMQQMQQMQQQAQQVPGAVAQQMQQQQQQMQSQLQQMQMRGIDVSSAAVNQQMQGNPIRLDLAGPPAGAESPVAGQLCPELAGARVPANSQFPMKVPILLHDIKEDQEHAIVRNVQAKDGTPMFNLKVTRRKPLPHETNHPEEYIRLSLPDEDSRELVLCAFGRPSGKLECHIYQLGKDPWGIIREDPEPGSYTIFLRNSNPALTATVSGSGADRRVRITQAGNKDKDVATAIQTGPAHDHAFYEVECYPLCDIILTIVMLTGVDRMSVNANR